jgi:hypothetical protein
VDTFKIVRQLSQVDGSIGQLYANQLKAASPKGQASFAGGIALARAGSVTLW